MAFGSADGPLSWKAADDTGDVEPLGKAVNQVPQAFSPDGTALVFEHRGGDNIDLGMLALVGDRTSTLVLNSRFGERNAALSPDGRWLAYESNESGRPEVYVRRFPAVNAGRWQISTEGGRWPAWNPAGRELFYRGPKGVVVQAFDTVPTFTPRARTQLLEWAFVGAGLGTGIRRMAVSPDGQRFLLLKDATTPSGAEAATPPQIIVVTNWFEELKRLVPIR